MEGADSASTPIEEVEEKLADGAEQGQQGVGNTAKHSQVAEIWFSAVPNFVGALTLQGGVW